jgi:hypothetical protein
VREANRAVVGQQDDSDAVASGTFDLTTRPHDLTPGLGSDPSPLTSSNRTVTAGQLSRDAHATFW